MEADEEDIDLNCSEIDDENGYIYDANGPREL